MKAKIKIEFPQQIYENEDQFDAFFEEFESEEKGPYRLIIDQFMLDSVNKTTQDRMQVNETNLYPVVFSFGRKATMYQFQLKLRNSENKLNDGVEYNWLEKFEQIIDTFNAKTIIDYDLTMSIEYKNTYMQGVWNNISIRQQGQNDKMAVVSFKFIATVKYTPPKVVL